MHSCLLRACLWIHWLSASLGTSQQTRINWVTGKGWAGEEGRPWSPTVLLLCRAFCMRVIQSPDSLHTLAFGSGLLELSPATYVFIYSFTLKKRFDTRVCLKKEKQKGNKNKNPSGEYVLEKPSSVVVAEQGLQGQAVQIPGLTGSMALSRPLTICGSIFLICKVELIVPAS